MAERSRTLITKYQDEDYKQEIDFTDSLFGRTIASAAVETYRADLRTVQVNSELTPDVPTVSGGARVLVRLTGGTLGVRYLSFLYATLNTGEVIGHQLETEVR